MTNQQGAPEALRPIARYKIGYATDGWGMRSSTPSGIPHHAGAWVRYEDHVAALVEAQQPAPSAAGRVKLPEPDTAETAPWTGWKVKYHSPDQIIGYGNQQFNAGRQFEVERLVALWAPQPSSAPQTDRQPAAQQWNDLIGKETHADADGLLVWRDEVDFAAPTPQADSAPSAAAPVGEVPLPLLVRDIAADLGTTPIQVCTALAQLGFGGHSVNMAVTPRMAKSLRAHFASPTPQADSQPAPIDMVLHCPACGLQHIDASEPPVEFEPGAAQWNNPPHRSHLCHGCGHIWRPADVPTNGVKAVKTKGKADSPIAARAPADSVTAPAGESRCANCGKSAADSRERIADYPEEGEWFCSAQCKDQHDELDCPHLTHNGYRHPAESERLIACEGVLRSLASWLGVGGFNAPTVDAKVFEEKIRWGIEHLLQATPPAQADSVLEDAARLEQIAEAIRDYHYALDMRKHGGLAESAAFSSICNTMGMHWNRGEEAARRAAREQGGA